jgi:hypothetical protein
MAAEKPAIVVFAGAYHKSSCMRLFIDSLRQAGFEADSYSLASIEDSTKAVDDDEVVIRSETEKRVENGRDVLLILHSFAGFGGSAAMSGLDKKTRAEYKQPNGLAGVIFLVAFIPLEGETVLTILDSPHPSTVIRVCSLTCMFRSGVTLIPFTRRKKVWWRLMMATSFFTTIAPRMWLKLPKPN